MLQLHLSDQQLYCLLRCVLYQRLDGSYDPFYLNTSSSCFIWLMCVILLLLSVCVTRPKQNGHRFADGSFQCIFPPQIFIFWFKLRGNMSTGVTWQQIMISSDIGLSSKRRPMMAQLADSCMESPGLNELMIHNCLSVDSYSVKCQYNVIKYDQISNNITVTS